MTLHSSLSHRLRLPVIGSPMFLVSGPELVLAQCRAGIIGAFPTLNARPLTRLDEWLHQITETLAATDPETVAPFAVNLVVHRSNDRLEDDLALCVKWRVPIVITSLGARPDVNDAIHAYGGITLHDVVSNRFARKAVEKGADGLVAVAAGAGGHAGVVSPFALVSEIREWFDGPLALAGSIANGAALAAAISVGADLAYVGSAFIPCDESRAADAYKDMVVASGSEDIVYSSRFTGVHGNYLRPSIVAAGLDPDDAGPGDPSRMDFGAGGASAAKAWRDIWGAGHGIGSVSERLSVSAYVTRLQHEMRQATQRLNSATSMIRKGPS